MRLSLGRRPSGERFPLAVGKADWAGQSVRGGLMWCSGACASGGSWLI